MISDATWQAMVITLPSTIAALGALFQGIRNGRKADLAVATGKEVKAQTAEVQAQTAQAVATGLEVKEKTEANLNKADQISNLVNGNLITMKADLVLAHKKIERLQTLIDQLVAQTK